MLNSNEKEGTTNDILLSLALINVKDSQNFYVGVSKPRLSVLGCLEQYNLNETSNCVIFIFFQIILHFEIGGAAYTQTFTVIYYDAIDLNMLIYIASIHSFLF